MKKNLLVLFLGILGSFGLNAQCDLLIPPFPGSAQIDSDQSLDAEGLIYWVCENVNLTVTSSPGAAFYLEAGATITFEGTDGDAVAAKEGCVITNNTEEAVTVIANSSTVTLNNTGGGVLLVGIECLEVSFQYTFVDEATCMDIINVEESVVSAVSVYPNPVAKGDDLYISVPAAADLTIFNSLGQNIRTISNFQGVLNTKSLASGNYILSIQMEDETIHRRLRVL